MFGSSKENCMKIAYCIRSLKGTGGMERVLANKANYLAEKLGYDVAIITLDQPEEKTFFEFSPRIRRYGLGVEYNDTTQRSPLLSPWITLNNMRRHRKKLENLLKELRMDIVVSMFDTEARFLWKIKDGSKKVLEVHFSQWGRQRMNKSRSGRYVDKVKSIYDHWIVGKYDAFVVLTEEDRKCWKQARNISVIYNACTLRPVQQAALVNKNVLAVGRLTEQKGFDWLVEIWEKVNQYHPDWQLTIIGEGEQKAMLEEKIRFRQLEGKIEILPFTSSVEDFYLKSSICVVTSRYEGFSMVLAEAMACGVPAVSFACPSGPAEIILEGKNGFLVPVGDQDFFVKRICQLIKNAELRKQMGKEAFLSSSRFSEDRIMQKWDHLFITLKSSDENLLL